MIAQPEVSGEWRVAQTPIDRGVRLQGLSG